MTKPEPETGDSQNGTRISVLEKFPALKWYPQQKEWIRDPWGSDNACFNYPLALHIQGQLKPEALRLGLEEVVRRHQVLRSMFAIESGEVVQQILPPSAFSIAGVDLEAASEDERQRLATQLAVEDAQLPFDLARQPLFRGTLLRLSQEEHLLLLTTHHFVCDDWSTNILLTELAQLYSAFSRNHCSPLSEVLYHYSNFVREHAREMQAGEGESELQFWKKQLAGCDFFHLATDYPRPKARMCNGKRKEVVFPAKLDQALKNLNQSNSLSSFITLSAGFMCLLRCYSGNGDIGVGICVANRNSVEDEQLIGPFSNRVVLRTEIGDELTVHELLEQIRDAAWEVYSCQKTPFGEVVEKVVPPGDARRNSLLQTLIVYENAPRNAWEFRGLKVSRFSFDTGMACYDLHIWLRDQGGLEMAIQYNADLFGLETIDQIVHDYQRILEAMVENPAAKVRDILGFERMLNYERRHLQTQIQHC